MDDPLILTLALDHAAEAFFEAERRAHFPPERNMIPAHVTLFHQLPGERIEAVRAALADIVHATPPLDARVTGVMSLGRGVAYRIEVDGFAPLHDRLRAAWTFELAAQDRGRPRLHVTVQNKVDPARARATKAELEAAFTPFEATATGLRLWHYRGGPWEAAGAYGFSGGSA